MKKLSNLAVGLRLKDMMHISPEVLKMLGYNRVKHFDRKACQAVVEITFIICLMHEKVALDF